MSSSAPKFQIEWGKLGLIGLLMTFGFVLVTIALLTDIPDDRFAAILALATGCITGPAGYLYGNGRLASKGEQSVPTLAPHPDRVAQQQISATLQVQGVSRENADVAARHAVETPHE